MEGIIFCGLLPFLCPENVAVNVFHIFLQMALWRSSDNLVYLPPTPVSKVISTDDYVTRTNIYYYAGSSRLLTVGHPYYSIPKSSSNKVDVPKVSAYQYRVFRVRLPDPNKFGLPDARIYNPEAERLVWACTGVEVGRGQPLGVGLSGHPLYNKLNDIENSNIAHAENGQDSRDNIAVDYKQTQLCILGCTPPMGEHWGKGTVCARTSSAAGDCPPLELMTTHIEDGDMVDTGYGAMDFTTLQVNKSDVPLDICQSTCKYPDYLGMAADPYGDSMFFFLRREQLFARHFFNRAGAVGDKIPDSLYLKGNNGRETPGSAIYSPTPSGSMVTSEAQIFNKPYWLQQAQGHNNGICWANQVFLTVVDTTRSTNMSLCATTESQPLTTYDATKLKEYLRHGEEYDLQFIFQLCKVTLTPEIMAYLHTMNSALLEDWNFGLTLPPSTSLEDTYRFVTSSAITCQKEMAPTEKQDPYSKLNFWDVDLKDRFTLDLSQFPLGRKFLLQIGARRSSVVPARKRRATTTAPTPAKRKRSKK